MRIAFPTEEKKGMESPVHGHFGSARHFLIVDSDTGAFELVLNHDRDHQHGRCQPLDALGGKPVDAVVVGGIGGGALYKLGLAGIKTYRAVEGTVDENLRLINSGMLPLFTMEQTCAGHSTDGECVH